MDWAGGAAGMCWHPFCLQAKKGKQKQGSWRKGVMTLLLMGDINVDTTMNIHKYPELGGDAFANHISTQPGGGIVNSSASLAGLGESVALLAATGQDVWAEMVLKPVEALGVDISRVVRLPNATTGLIFLPIADGERTMFSFRGANMLFHPDWVTEQTLHDVDLLHWSGYALLTMPFRDAIKKAVRLAREANIPISLDTALEPVLQQTESFRRLLPDLSVCILGLEEAQVLVGGESPEVCADLLLAAGVKLVGLKLGRHGALLASSEEKRKFPIFKVDTVDTTGAGDSFSSGLIYAYHHGLDLETAGTLASALGALATTIYGGGLGMDWHGKLKDFLEERRGQPDTEAFGNGIENLLGHLVEMEGRGSYES
jgi:sugar/nucleoside kinase (ribokinase family)